MNFNKDNEKLTQCKQGGGYLSNNELTPNKKYVVILLILLLGIVTLTLNTSYNLFSGDLNYKIENDELVDNSVIIDTGDKLELTLNLKSKNWIDSNYELYYLVDGEKNSNDNIEIGYKEESIDKAKGVIKARDTKQISLSIKNRSDKSVKITFGCEGSKIDEEVILSKGNTLNNLIMDNNTFLAYTYVGTGTTPATFPDISDGYHVTNLTCTGGTAEWDNDTWTMKVLTTTGNSLVCNATIINLYQDNSGAARPVIEGDLIPVIISDTGVVTKADIYEEWYDYNASEWANAVILNDGYGPYNDGATIPEAAIESYFVWIPRFKYKIFNTGNYTSLTSTTTAEQEIEIEFEKKTTAASTGSTVGTWLTHPAFISFDSNGYWVGKFESGYRGATSTSGAQKNENDYTKLIIKPNVYSWRAIKVGNAFKTSYDYERNLDSHMMKNTEWGAVAYLSHSKYGNMSSVRVNNNSGYITGYSATEEPTKGYVSTSSSGNRVEKPSLGNDGNYTINYFNTSSVVSSSTGNYSGIYDMSGGSYEYVMGNVDLTNSSSGLTSIISDFFTNSIWNKYYDRYTSTSSTSYNNRILGDATGELGPFKSYVAPNSSTVYASSWYGDYSHFAVSSQPWFRRSGDYRSGTGSGIFTFNKNDGAGYEAFSFRVVLTPQD